jgi:hypothetical protein
VFSHDFAVHIGKVNTTPRDGLVPKRGLAPDVSPFALALVSGQITAKYLLQRGVHLIHYALVFKENADNQSIGPQGPH